MKRSSWSFTTILREIRVVLELLGDKLKET